MAARLAVMVPDSTHPVVSQRTVPAISVPSAVLQMMSLTMVWFAKLT